MCASRILCKPNELGMHFPAQIVVTARGGFVCQKYPAGDSWQFAFGIWNLFGVSLCALALFANFKTMSN